MLTDQHPITPPPELVQQWWGEADKQLSSYYDYIATQAARWGADQELEACSEWLLNSAPWTVDPNERPEWVQTLKRCRRPKPPSLAEEALEACERSAFGIPGDRDIIRRALERLQELENNG